MGGGRVNRRPWNEPIVPSGFHGDTLIDRPDTLLLEIVGQSHLCKLKDNPRFMNDALDIDNLVQALVSPMSMIYPVVASPNVNVRPFLRDSVGCETKLVALGGRKTRVRHCS